MATKSLLSPGRVCGQNGYITNGVLGVPPETTGLKLATSDFLLVLGACYRQGDKGHETIFPRVGSKEGISYVVVHPFSSSAAILRTMWVLETAQIK